MDFSWADLAGVTGNEVLQESEWGPARHSDLRIPSDPLPFQRPGMAGPERAHPGGCRSAAARLGTQASARAGDTPLPREGNPRPPPRSSRPWVFSPSSVPPGLRGHLSAQKGARPGTLTPLPNGCPAPRGGRPGSGLQRAGRPEVTADVAALGQLEAVGSANSVVPRQTK